MLRRFCKRFFCLPYWKEKQRDPTLPGTRYAYRNVLDIAVPSVAEMLLISLISSVDMMMVGTLGKEALSAVGLTSQPRLVVLCFFTALNVGVSAVCAHRKGEGRRQEANQTLRMSLVLSLVLSLALLALTLPLSEPLMRLAGGTDDNAQNAAVLSQAVDYFRILTYSLPLNALSLSICAAQRGIGRAKVTFQVNVLSNLINVAFNYLLIEGRFGFPRMEVRGAAVASVIGIAAGFLFALLTVCGPRSPKRFLQLSLRGSWKAGDSLASVLKIGGNAMIEQIGMRIGFFICGRIYFALGTTQFAAHQICMQVLNLTFAFGDGLGIAATSLVGQSLGQKRPEWAVAYGKICQRCAVVLSLALMALLALGRQFIAQLYIDPQTADAAQVVAAAARTLVVLAFMQPFQINAFAIAGGLRGAGDNLYVAVVAMVCVSLIRPALVYVSVYVLHFDLAAIWVMAMSEMALRCLCFYPRFVSGRWKNIKV